MNLSSTDVKEHLKIRPYIKGESLDGISLTDTDKASGSPKLGDMIARNPKDHEDRWLVSQKYFLDNLELIE